MPRTSSTTSGDAREMRALGGKGETFVCNLERVKKASGKAQQIVLRLIENTLDEVTVCQAVKHLTKSHYEDVTLERSLYGACGYPVCSNKLKDAFGKRTYIIRSNNVYDIEDRRKFCSDVCFEASEIVLDQIPETPPYLRETEVATVEVTLPILAELKGRYGKLVNIKGSSFDYESELKGKRRTCTSGYERRSTESGVVTTRDEYRPCHVKSNGKSICGSTESDASRDSQVKCIHDCRSDCDASKSRHKATVENGAKGNSASNLGSHEKEKKSDKLESSSPFTNKVIDAGKTLQLVYEVEHCLREWMTFDALRVVLGDEYVRGMLEELVQRRENFDTTEGVTLGVEAQAHFVALYHKLAQEEALLEWGTGRATGARQVREDDRRGNEYVRLQEEVMNQMIKVDAFYKGKDYITEESDKDAEETKASSDEAETTGKVRVRFDGSLVENPDICLPFIDSCSQQAWRRQIVMECLQKVLQTHTSFLRLRDTEVFHVLIPLMATFEFSPNNITFRPMQWDLIGLALIKMLEVRNLFIQESVNSRDGQEYITSFLEFFSLDAKYLDRLISYLTEINYIVAKNVNKESNSADQQESETGKRKCDVNISGQVAALSIDVSGIVQQNAVSTGLEDLD